VSTKADAREFDPQTSHDAAKNVEESGRAGSHRKACYEYVLKNPGKTAGEIAAAIGLERHVPSRRLPELRAAGLVENGPARFCTVQKTRAMTWVVPQVQSLTGDQQKLFS